MKPRTFQESAMAQVGHALRSADRGGLGKRAIVVVAPTGSGKSFLAAMMAARFVAQGRRVAWGAHRDELLTQGVKALAACGVESGMSGLNRSAMVQMGSYQSWSARGSVPEADVFIADEVHHMGSHVGWRRIAQGYREAGKILIGVTATPARGDGAALSDFDHIVVGAQIADMVRAGILVPLRWRGPGATLASQRIAQNPVDAYLEECPGRAAVVFSPNMNAATSFTEAFRAKGIRAAIVHGEMADKERAETLRKFAENDGVDVLVNIHLLTEGWDAPRCDCVIMARGCSSPVLWIQAAGRGLRAYCGCGKLSRGEACSCLKKDCLLLDLRGIAHELGRPDAEATYSLDGAGIVLAPSPDTLGERLCKVCKEPLGDEMVCVNCGKDHSPPVPKSVNAPLTDWEERFDAAKAAINPNKIVTALASIMRKAEESAVKGKKWKPGAVATRFSFIFHRRPFANELAAAANLLAAAGKFEPEQGRLA